MSRCGDVYENRVTGELAVVLRGDEDGFGRAALVHLVVRPGGAVVGEHIHPTVEERFRVVAGRLATRIAGVDRVLGTGEEAVAAAGTPHDWWNDGDEEASVVVELTPPDPRFEQMIATLFGLANRGDTDARGRPGPLQMALTASEFSDVIRLTRPPAFVQRVAFAALGAIGRRRGLQGRYPELLTPHGRTTPAPAALAAAGLEGKSGTR